MLRELHISNLAVISDVRIELSPGLNCFTGATGAGKSLVIGAVELLLGLRSATDMLRAGVDEGRVSGAFELKNPRSLQQIETLTDVSVTQDGGEILLTRRLYRSGRSSISLNGHPITLGMLKQLAETLVDVHGQHEHQFLLRPSNQLEVLDEFGNLQHLHAAYHDLYRQVEDARHRLDSLSADRLLRQQQLELYRFQADEIDAAELNAAEYAELVSRVTVLQNLEKLRRDVGATHSALYEAEGAVLERLKAMTGILGELALLDTQLAVPATGLRDATIQLEEIAYDLSRYLDKLDLDPSELAEVNERLNTVNRVLNKYEKSVEATLSFRDEIGGKIDELSKQNDDLSALARQLEPLNRQLLVSAQELSERRKTVAVKLAPAIERELKQLGMEHAKFTIEFTASVPSTTAHAPGPSGIDQIEFIAQTNPGQAPLPLRKIASGGELSRIMLALKSILADNQRISVLVFDEIDANVGGRLGSIIGEKLRGLASKHQVLCITHLPQIASYADRHLTVQKIVRDGQTQTSVRVIDGDERMTELAEMIGGALVTDTTRAQVHELLEAARSAKIAAPVNRAKIKSTDNQSTVPKNPIRPRRPTTRSR